ncbi:MAG: hypothetical protein HYZ23_05745, partial [Chloroflexi bacterium]|nr:hypothetical protein [Chloroflexota bacterium]
MEMSLKTGVDETYYRSFVLDENGLREFQKMMGNAAQRFPAPAEVTYTIVTSDFRYFETMRFEDILHDLEGQKKGIIQIAMRAGFVEEPPRIEGDIVREPRGNWNISLNFNIVQKDFWDRDSDRISL